MDVNRSGFVSNGKLLVVNAKGEVHFVPTLPHQFRYAHMNLLLPHFGPVYPLIVVQSHIPLKMLQEAPFWQLHVEEQFLPKRPLGQSGNIQKREKTQ